MVVVVVCPSAPTPTSREACIEDEVEQEAAEGERLDQAMSIVTGGRFEKEPK